MEVGDSRQRPSGVTSISNLKSDLYTHHPRESVERPPYREEASMATATLINPTTPFHPHQSGPFSSNYHSATVAGMISPVEPRRTSDDTSEGSQRPSLPSLSEIISGKSNAFPAPPAAPPASQAPPLPSPFSTSTPTRPFPDNGSDKQPSPRTVYPPTSFPGPEPTPAYSESARSGYPPQSHSSQSSAPYPPGQRHPSPPRPEHGPPMDSRSAESQHHHSGSFSHRNPHPPPPPYQSGQLPPGQMPLPGPPMFRLSPRNGPPALPSPFDPTRPMVNADEFGFGRTRAKHEPSMARHFETWSYPEYLARIASTSRTLYTFAECYSNIAREEHNSQPIPGRLPSEREIAEMFNNADLLRGSLEEVRNIVQQSIIDERAREGMRNKGSFDDDDVSMYGDGIKSQYGPGEVKKRRGRAAPPGRCHSCNRVDTPEWRRGPDGARTLCNACGLHYAKLERKRNSEHKNIRPKPTEEQIRL